MVYGFIQFISSAYMQDLAAARQRWNEVDLPLALAFFSLRENASHFKETKSIDRNVKIMDQDHDGRNPKKSIVTNCVDEELIGSTR